VKKFVMALLCFVCANTVNAAAIDCRGQINAFLVYANGSVNVRPSWAQDYVYICNLKTERQGVSIATCAVWSAMIQSARKVNKSLSFYYDVTNASFSSCSTVPVYSGAPAPVYIGEF